MQKFSASPYEMFASLWRHRKLIRVSTKREVLGRYRGSALGLLWSLFNPLFMLAVYTFVFSVVFKARWGTSSESKTEFALVLFAGLIIFNLFADCINRAPSLIISNQNYVKKVVFPLEILPFVVFLSAAYHALISLTVWLMAYILFVGIPHISIVYLPLIIIPFGLFVMGVAWFLASLGVFLRDVNQFIGMLVMVLMFMSPIFYPATALPEQYQNILFWNPLTVFIELARDILYWGRGVNWLQLVLCWLLSLVVAWAGFAWFQKTRKGFADVL